MNLWISPVSVVSKKLITPADKTPSSARYKPSFGSASIVCNEYELAMEGLMKNKYARNAFLSVFDRIINKPELKSVIEKVPENIEIHPFISGIFSPKFRIGIRKKSDALAQNVEQKYSVSDFLAKFFTGQMERDIDMGTRQTDFRECLEINPFKITEEGIDKAAQKAGLTLQQLMI